MDSLLKELGINFKVVFVQIVAFLLLFWILKKFLFGRIVTYMTARRDEIQNTFYKIEKDKQDVARLTAEYQAKLANIEKEAYEKIQQAVKEGLEAKKRIMTEAQAQSQQEVEKARAEIEREKDKALVELRQEVVRLSLQAAEKLVDSTMDPKTHGRLVERFLNEMEEVKKP